MSRGSHRSEPVGRVWSRSSRAAVAAGVTLALVGVALAVSLRPDTGSASVVEATQALTATDTLRADALVRADERAARNRPRSPLPTTTPPTPAPVPKVVVKRWVIAAVNVRSGPAAGTDRVGSLKALTQVGATGRTRSGWTQVVLDDRPGWVRSTFLSTSKPKPASPTTVSGVSAKRCSISPSIEQHLTANARAVYRAVCAAHGSKVSSFGGYRAGDDGDHGSGRAVDIMVSGDPGKVIARYVQAHAGALHVTYVIYQQKIWMAGNPVTQWKAMADRGSSTANHYDHVHVSVS